MPPLTMKFADTMPTKLAMAPTERSMPPVMITKVRPRPMMALTLAETATSRRLPMVRNCGLSRPRMRNRTTAAM